MMGRIRPKEECVGCGYCCIQKPCSFCKIMYPEDVAGGTICPLLEWNGEKYTCRLVMMPGYDGNFYRYALGVGRGCRNYLNPWRKDVRPRQGIDDG